MVNISTIKLVHNIFYQAVPVAGMGSGTWLQLGIVNEQAAEAAKKAGSTVVIDKCMMIEHKLFF